MIPKNIKFRVPRLSTFAAIALVGFTAWDFMGSWHRHSPSRFGYGIILALAVGATLIFSFVIERK